MLQLLQIFFLHCTAIPLTQEGSVALLIADSVISYQTRAIFRVGRSRQFRAAVERKATDEVLSAPAVRWVRRRHWWVQLFVSRCSRAQCWCNETASYSKIMIGQPPHLVLWQQYVIKTKQKGSFSHQIPCIEPLHFNSPQKAESPIWRFVA